MSKFGKVAALTFSMAVIAGCGLAVAKRRDITDWLVLRNYQASEELSSIAERTTMTNEGRKLFYVYDPQLLDKSGFNFNCTVGEKSIVLGCYDSKGIYLYDISDTRLNGVEEVTAAHEMLHAAYERLNDKEKQNLRRLLDEALESNNNQRITELVASYRERDPSSIYNEMHSIFGTEVRVLPAELEEYYSRYFSNRLVIVDYSEKYESVFVELENQVEKIDADLLLRKSEIETNEASLELQAANLTAWAVRLEQYRSNNDIDRYNSEVGQYNQSVNDYNADLLETRELIKDYNRLVEERNSLALQQNELIKSLDSKARDL